MLINYFEIVLNSYHGEIVGRIRYTADSEVCESGLYSLMELNSIIILWKNNNLLGSFAMGHQLSPDFTFQLVHN